MRPSYAELAEALGEALGHLDFCGWGDSYERDTPLRNSLPKVLERTAEPFKVQLSVETEDR